MFLSKTFAVWIKLVALYIYKCKVNKYKFMCCMSKTCANHIFRNLKQRTHKGAFHACVNTDNVVGTCAEPDCLQTAKQACRG